MAVVHFFVRLLDVRFPRVIFRAIKNKLNLLMAQTDQLTADLAERIQSKFADQL